MRKLMLFVCSICICILSSFSNVFATNVNGFDIRTHYRPDGGGSDIEFVNSCELPSYSKRTFYTSVYFPDVISANTQFDLKLTLITNGAYFASDFKLYTYVDTGNNSTGYVSIPADTVVCDTGDSEGLSTAVLTFKNLVSSVDCKGVRIAFYITPYHLNTSLVATSCDVSYFSEKTLLGNILQAISSIPNMVANAFNKFFHSDDPIVDESETLNNELSNSINDYNDVESGLTDNLQNNISNLDTTVDLFNVSDFNATSIFLSQQLTNIFNINENIRNMIMYSLIMGFSLVLIGIGVKR